MGLFNVDGQGCLSLNLHPGQLRAWDSLKRIVAIIAGFQSGKSEFGPVWLWAEIQRRGPGDYLVVTPTYPLLGLKALPAFRRYFETTMQLGRFVGSPTRVFTFSPEGSERIFGERFDEPTQIFFGHAQDPESLESATAKAAWLDEAGQGKFKLGSWEAIQRRLAIHQGRVLISTTPYNLGWLKTKIYDPWVKSGKNHPEIDIINFDSTLNPVFPKEEAERAKRELPPWKFDMMVRGLFTRPAGLIYGSFQDHHRVARFEVPVHWPRYLGLDFGGVNTAGIFVVQDPVRKNFFAYREYHPGEGRTASSHVAALLCGEPGGVFAVGGAGSEDQWRAEFRAAGLAVQEPPITEVEVGIDRVYAAFSQERLYVFDDLTKTLEELATYSRELDEQGEPTVKISDKEQFHLLDATRYIVSWLHSPIRERPAPLPTPVQPSPHQSPRGVFRVVRGDVKTQKW